jgi:hypothetical protein
MKHLMEGGVSSLINVVSEQTVLTEAQRPQSEEMFTRPRELIQNKFGKPTREYELIKQEVLGQSYVRLTFLEKYERSGVVWRFTFYKRWPGNGVGTTSRWTRIWSSSSLWFHDEPQFLRRGLLSRRGVRVLKGTHGTTGDGFLVAR